VVLEEKIFKEINQSEKIIACLLTDRDEIMSNLFWGPSLDASYQVVSEEKIKMWNVKVMAKAHIAFDKVS
jgi:hypothetical protein